MIKLQNLLIKMTEEVIPNAGLVFSAGKFGSRFAKACLSFTTRGGFASPGFYLNASSSSFALGSTICQLGVIVLPGWSVPLYSASVCFGQAGDELENAATITGILL